MNKQEALIWNILNNAQSKGVIFLIQYENNWEKKSPELDQWYKETKEEFQIIQKFKDMLNKND